MQCHHIVFGLVACAYACEVGHTDDKITIPVAVTAFPGEIYRAPESWARRAYKTLIYFHAAPKGGHFAAWEAPQTFADEMRAAFRTLRATGATNGSADDRRGQ